VFKDQDRATSTTVTISSPHNERLKELRKLARRRARDQAGRFVAEGEDLLAAADAAGWPALERYCAAGSGLAGVEVEPELLAGVSQLGSGTRTLAVYEQRWVPAPVGPLCVHLHGIADPGNVGAVLRSALAFGAASVSLGPDCADPYGPKAVRASMGAIFAVPMARARARAGSTESGDRSVEAGGVPAPTGLEPTESGGGSAWTATVAALPGTTIALDAHAGEPLRGPAEGAVTVIVGAERAGLPAELIAACDRVARIPIRSESLNAAMAATVALYELTRDAPAPLAEAPGADHRMGTA
jgi:TrmH family RNA methyltransferase